MNADDNYRRHQQTREHWLGHFATPRRNNFQALKAVRLQCRMRTISLALPLRSPPHALFSRVLHPGHFRVSETLETLEIMAAMQRKVASPGNDTVLNRP